MAAVDFNAYMDKYLGKRVRFQYKFDHSNAPEQTVEGVVTQICIPAVGYESVGFSFLLKRDSDTADMGEYYDFNRDIELLS